MKRLVFIGLAGMTTLVVFSVGAKRGQSFFMKKAPTGKSPRDQKIRAKVSAAYS